MLTPAGARVLSEQLAAEVGRVHTEAARLAALAAAVAPTGPSDTELWAAAGRLQALYTGIEALLLRIFKMVDGFVPAGADSHQEILRQAALAVPEVRPAVFDADLVSALESYRAFRHFFGHAYGVTLRWERMAEKVTGAQAVVTRVERAIEAFREFLAATAQTA